MLRRQKHALSKSTTPSACALSKVPRIFGPAPLQKVVGDFLLYKFWRILPGIFLEDFSGHFFPTKMRRKNPATKIREKIRRLKNKNPRKIRSARIRHEDFSRRIPRHVSPDALQLQRPDFSQRVFTLQTFVLANGSRRNCNSSHEETKKDKGGSRRRGEELSSAYCICNMQAQRAKSMGRALRTASHMLLAPPT